MTVFSHVSSVLKKIFGSRYRKEAFKYWVLYSNKWFTNGFYYFLTIFMEKRIKAKVIELCHNTACMLKWFYFTRIYVKFWIFFCKAAISSWSLTYMYVTRWWNLQSPPPTFNFPGMIFFQYHYFMYYICFWKTS